MKIKILMISIAFILFSTVAMAQVTIGSKELPRKGTLLDIKENNNTGKIPNTANKGLGLPRVALEYPTTLTIDHPSEDMNYVGTMVYNTTTSPLIKEGIYCWTGYTWKQAIVVNTPGTNGTILKSNGDGTYDWTYIEIPAYKYHKPTNVKGYKEKNANTFQYQYRDIVNTFTGRTGVYQPDYTLFTNQFLYTDTINILSDISTKKYMLLGTTVSTKKETVGNYVPAVTTWESMKFEVILTPINDNGSLGTSETIKNYQKLANIIKGGTTLSYFDLFSIIPLNNLNKGKYQVKIKAYNYENSFSVNTNFVKTDGAPFYTVALEDINFVVYEYD